MISFACHVALVLLAAPPDGSTVHRPGWAFVAEDVVVDVSGDAFVVRAEYTFRVSGDAPAMVFRYPFPDDASLGAPELLEASIRGSAGWEGLSIHVEEGCWRWIAESGGGLERSVRIVYRQTTASERARYVLRSTQTWGRPLDRAHLEVRVPENRKCNISPDLPFAYVVVGRRVYQREFFDFLPQTDLVVELIEGLGSTSDPLRRLNQHAIARR